MTTIEIQSHRGNGFDLPENTLDAFSAAVENYIDRIEIDVQLTEDLIPVIHHDFYINSNKCTYRDGSPISSSLSIMSQTLSSLKKIVFKNGLQEIPSLKECLELIRGKTTGLNIEIKSDPKLTHTKKVLAKAVLDLIQSDFAYPKVYISSFDIDLLACIRELDSSITLAVLQEESLEDLLEKALRVKASIVSPEHVLIKNKSQVTKFHEHAIKIIPWTVNCPSRAKELIAMGVDGIITDYPALIRAIK